MTARIYSSAMMGDRALRIDVSIIDKVITGTLIDGGSGINIMPLFTMESLGIKLTSPTSYVVYGGLTPHHCPWSNCELTHGGRGRALYINLPCF